MHPPSELKNWKAPPRDAWAAWSPDEIATRLAGVDIAWSVIGGWAIDLFLGAQTRPHDDLEIAIPRGELSTLRNRLAAFRCFVIGDGAAHELAPDAEPPPDKHQNGFHDGAAWKLDVMLEPGDAQTWIYRRDTTIRAPRQHMLGVTANGIPYLAPQAVLLYKAKEPRPKDEADFAAVRPRLDGAARTWLHDALGRLYPDHQWLAMLLAAR